MNPRKKAFLYVLLILLILVAVPLLSQIQHIALNLFLRIFLITMAIYLLLELMQLFKKN